jgi:hypothetical protein
MLVEISSEAIGEERGSRRRRLWFHSDAGELYVWRGASDRIEAFQISFFDNSAEERREWWLEWGAKGAKAGLVDSKEADSRTHDLKSPTVELSSARVAEAALLAKRFLSREGAGLPAALRGFLDEKIASLA